MPDRRAKNRSSQPIVSGRHGPVFQIAVEGHSAGFPVETDYSNIVGLPLALVYRMLRESNLAPPPDFLCVLCGLS
jgi:hypothetical protein